MAFQDLSKLGYTPAGTGGSAFEQILSGIGDSVSAFTKTYTEVDEKKTKREKEKVDTYIKLRKAGYSKKEAYEATLKGAGYSMPTGDVNEDLGKETPSKVKNRIKMKIYNSERLTEKEFRFAEREALDVPEDSFPESFLTKVKKPQRRSIDIGKGLKKVGGWFSKKMESLWPAEKAEADTGDKTERARKYLISKGRKGTDSEIKRFLEKYPDF